MDLSRKALLAAGGVGDGAARPSLGQGAPRAKGDPNLAGALQGAPPDRRETPAHPRGECDWEPKPGTIPERGNGGGVWGLPWTPGGGEGCWRTPGFLGSPGAVGDPGGCLGGAGSPQLQPR